MRGLFGGAQGALWSTGGGGLKLNGLITIHRTLS